MDKSLYAWDQLVLSFQMLYILSYEATKLFRWTVCATSQLLFCFLSSLFPVVFITPLALLHYFLDLLKCLSKLLHFPSKRAGHASAGSGDTTGVRWAGIVWMERPVTCLRTTVRLTVILGRCFLLLVFSGSGTVEVPWTGSRELRLACAVWQRRNKSSRVKIFAEIFEPKEMSDSACFRP